MFYYKLFMNCVSVFIPYKSETSDFVLTNNWGNVEPSSLAGVSEYIVSVATGFHNDTHSFQ